ncbi:MAG: hypothetical protein Q8P23_01270 [bacterium]|nr:hypothetical protein [bacterium]
MNIDMEGVYGTRAAQILLKKAGEARHTIFPENASAVRELLQVTEAGTILSFDHACPDTNYFRAYGCREIHQIRSASSKTQIATTVAHDKQSSKLIVYIRKEPIRRLCKGRTVSSMISPKTGLCSECGARVFTYYSSEGPGYGIKYHVSGRPNWGVDKDVIIGVNQTSIEQRVKALELRVTELEAYIGA